MSSACTMVSPSHVSVGPGGCVVDPTTALNRLSVSAAVVPRSTAMSFCCIFDRLKPDPISLGKKDAALTLAVAVMWASTSLTVHPSHRDGSSHAAASMVDRSVASAPRSNRIAGHTSTLAIDHLLLGCRSLAAAQV